MYKCKNCGKDVYEHIIEGFPSVDCWKCSCCNKTYNFQDYPKEQK